MLQTVEVLIDANGNILPIEPMPTLFQGRALLTLFHPYTDQIEKISHPSPCDRFDRARGSATIKWKTDELMHFLRGED